jgi:Mg-chelatase subunit ChlD
MALNWATKRKITITAIIVIVVGAIGGGIASFFFYDEPTCRDGVKNQNEVGADCGGPCSRLCDSQTSEPVVLWERVFSAVQRSYHAVAFIENKNRNAEAKNVPYRFQIFSKDNVKLKEIQGTTYIPPQKQFAVFEDRIQLSKEPGRITFAFTEKPQWRKSSDFAREQKVEIIDRSQTGLKASPRVQAVIKNTTLRSLPAVELVAMVLDSQQNVVGVSRTIEQNMKSEESRRVTFTWPEPFDLGTKTCKQPTDVMLVLDRSGSMNDDNQEPPQPLTAVKNAARSFVERLANKDKAGLVTFATDAIVDATLTSGYTELTSTIDNIRIQQPEQAQHTNIAAGIKAAMEEFASERHTNESRKAIVLLTDGIASRPLPPEESDADKDEYPKRQAREQAQKAREEQNTRLYAIGLGDEVEGAFLQKLAADSDRYFFAPKTTELSSIYEEIATSICEQGPSSVRIHTKVLPRDE